MVGKRLDEPSRTRQDWRRGGGRGRGGQERVSIFKSPGQRRQVRVFFDEVSPPEEEEAGGGVGGVVLIIMHAWA